MFRARSSLLLTLCCAWSVAASAQSFQDFLKRVDAESDSSRKSAIVDSFVAAQSNFPIVEDSTVYFLFRGGAASVKVVGDFSEWNPSESPSMARLPGSDFFSLARQFESDARLDYKFLVDEKSWILDPLNPQTVTGGFGTNSEVALPKYVQPVEILDHPEISHGLVQSDSIFSRSLNMEKSYRVYLPPGYDTSSLRYPSLYVHDGYDYLSLGSMANVLDYLIFHRRIQPVIAVFVPPGDRDAEYVGEKKDQHRTFVAEELRRHLDSRFRTIDSPSSRGIMGASNGGHVSLYIAYNDPEVFGLVAGQSSTVLPPDSGWYRPFVQDFFDSFAAGPVKPLRMYLDVGTYDVPGFLESNRKFRMVLLSKGYRVEEYQELHEGHSWGSWRAHLDDILTLFFPPAAPPGTKPKK